MRCWPSSRDSIPTRSRFWADPAIPCFTLTGPGCWGILGPVVFLKPEECNRQDAKVAKTTWQLGAPRRYPATRNP